MEAAGGFEGQRWPHPDQAVEGGVGGIEGRLHPGVERVGARAGRKHGAVEPAFGIGAILEAPDGRVGHVAIALERGVAGGALEEVGQADALQIAPGQGAAADDRRPQDLGGPNAGDAHLAQAATAAQAHLGLVDIGHEHAEAGHAGLVHADARPTAPDARGDPVHVHGPDDAAIALHREQVDVGHVTRLAEPDLHPPLSVGSEAVGHPRRRQVAVESGHRRVLGELRGVGGRRRPDIARPFERRHRLGIRSVFGERVGGCGVLVYVLVLGQGGTEVLLGELGDELAAPVRVGHHHLGARGRLRLSSLAERSAA